jgi:hypothetical protein
MEIPKDSYPQQNTLRFVAVVYHVVMLAAFAIGMYGLLSLFSLASAELQHSVHIISLP